MKITNVLTLLIGLVGTFQMVGHFAGSRTLRGLGLASGIAPFPKVFCEADGYEPFAAEFLITGSNADGEVVEIPLTAERYSQLGGPYQRRNVYGAALAYAPRLPDDFREHLFSQVLAPDSPLVSELDLPPLEDVEITIKPREGEAVSSYHYQLR